MHHTLTNGTCTAEDTKLESAYMHHSPQLIPFTTQYNLRTLLSTTYGSCNYAPLPSCTRPRAHRTADTPLIRLYTLIITALGVLVGLPVIAWEENTASTKPQTWRYYVVDVRHALSGQTMIIGRERWMIRYVITIPVAMRIRIHHVKQ